MQESIDKNKADADKQFSELLQLLKALQPPTTLPTTIPLFEENRQKLIDDLDEPLMVLESDGMINKNEFAVVAPVVAVAPIVVAPIAVAPVAPVVVTPVEPSFIPLGRKIKQNQAEQKLGCEICLQERVPAQRRTWDPGITQYDILKQHLEDKVKSVEDIVGFGAEQVILVRDDRTKTEVCEFVGKNALVLTTVEYKGLEFQTSFLDASRNFMRQDIVLLWTCENNGKPSKTKIDDLRKVSSSVLRHIHKQHYNLAHHEMPDSIMSNLDFRANDFSSMYPHITLHWSFKEASFRHVQGTTSCDLWLSLEKAYTPHSISREYTLKTQLLIIEMHGDETPDVYLNRAQEYADALAAIGEPVKDIDLVMLDVLGLCEEYNGLKTTITARQSPTAFNELHALLSDHDYMFGKTCTPVPSITSSFAANYAVGSPSMLEARQAQLSELTAQLSALDFQFLPIATI
ncbi:hypothetical protein Tco_0840926 [Tanacetum coccineum]|uniref:Uncharacterized protein n=1 Tax=Tanacetum coccineum TaxID=301880 RepID=A0ABQ5AZC6_9ASTR